MTISERIDKNIAKARQAVEEKRRAERIKRFNAYPKELRDRLRARGEDPTNGNNVIHR